MQIEHFVLGMFSTNTFIVYGNKKDRCILIDPADNGKQLAEWMYERVDVICQSWDISLAIPDGESMSSHQSEILAPIAQGGNSALNQYDANVGSWKPHQRS